MCVEMEGRGEASKMEQGGVGVGQSEGGGTWKANMHRNECGKGERVTSTEKRQQRNSTHEGSRETKHPEQTRT